MNENITSTMKKSRTAKKHNHAFSNNHFEMKKIKRKVANFGKKGDFAQRTGSKRRKNNLFFKRELCTDGVAIVSHIYARVREGLFPSDLFPHVGK